MKSKFSKALILVAALGASGASFAQVTDWQMHLDMLKMASLDANKDGMVSKAEFVKMMEKSFDMAMKKMDAKGDKMTEMQFKQYMENTFMRKGG
jgi:hypothetical protein